MANDTTLTVIGNLTKDPELRFTPSGAAVAKFTVASTPRVFDKTANEWKDGDSLFLWCTAWRDLAENVAESIHKGTRVIVSGRLRQRQYEPSGGGEKRTVFELEVDEVGPSLRYATAKVEKKTKGGYGGDEQWAGASRTRPAGGGRYAQTDGVPDDPWAVAPAPAGGKSGGSQFSDEPPF